MAALFTVAPGGLAATHVIKSGTRNFDAHAAGVSPGDVIMIEAGSRGALRIEGLRGNQRRPVLVRPGGETVIDGGQEAYAIAFFDSEHFHFTGLVDETQTEIPKLRLEGGQNTVTVAGFSSDAELSHLDVRGSGFSGIMIKQDPTDNPATWRETFVMRNLTVRDCVVTRTKGEGLYLGNSFYASGRPDGAGGKRWPHAIEGVRVFRNHTFDTGCEGIQVGSATKACEIFENTVEKFGQRPFGPWQDNGVQIGEGSGGVVRDNVIRDGPGNGIIVLGLGDNVIADNRIERVGRSGIDCQSRSGAQTGPGYQIVDNVIRETGEHAILVNAPEFAATLIARNQWVQIGRQPEISLSKGTRATVRDNQSK